MIDHHDFARAAKALEHAGFQKTMGWHVRDVMRKSANLVRKNARAGLAPHRRRGRLASGVRTYFKGTGLDSTATIRSTGPIAHLISGGVKPHTIEPGHVMAMVGREGKATGVVGFATVVQHPGFKADPYFSKAVRKSVPDINAFLRTAAIEMVHELRARMGR